MIQLSMNSLKHIGLALSGGGMRAAAFHAGVLKYLAEQELMESVIHVSSVSGGSLFTGLVFNTSSYRWPSSDAYLKVVLPKIRNLLTTKSLLKGAIYRLLFNPLNWRFVFSRANIVSKTIKSLWGINVPLKVVDGLPVWSINGTTAETGRRFRFKALRLGDYELGYANAADFPLSHAMAISAAFPSGIGPLSIKSKDFHWSKCEYWESVEGEKPCEPPFTRLHLYDGGLYDNLGIEPLFDVGKQAIKSGGADLDYLIVSDAGAELPRNSIPHPLSPFRFKRIVDIALDQTRSLRVRSFINFLQQNPASGSYLQIGADPTQSIKRLSSGREKVAQELLAERWLDTAETKKVASYPTSLMRMKRGEFDLLVQHGLETAKWNAELFV